MNCNHEWARKVQLMLNSAVILLDVDIAAERERYRSKSQWSLEQHRQSAKKGLGCRQVGLVAVHNTLHWLWGTRVIGYGYGCGRVTQLCVFVLTCI